MNPILQGSLRYFTAADVLTLLAARMQSGTVDFEFEGKHARVVLRDGKVAGADGDDVVSTVGMACYWTDGSFALQDKPVSEGVTAADYEVGALLDEVARRAAEAKAEAERYNDNATFRVIDDSDAQEKLGLTADELKLLIRIGLGRKFSDLIGARNRKEFIQTLKRLEGGGVIERISGEKGETPWQPEPKKEQLAAAPKPAPKADAKPEPPKEPGRPPASAPPAAPRPDAKAEAKPETPKEPARPVAPPAPVAAPAAKAEAKPEMPKEPARPPAPAASTVAAAAEATQSLRPERTAGRGLMASLTADSGNAYPLLEDEIFIGRAPTNTISLNDSSISTRHARISRTTAGFFLEDLKSRNGTFVNSEPVTEKRLLNDNDTVRLGKVIFTFNLAKETNPADTTAGIR